MTQNQDTMIRVENLGKMYYIGIEKEQGTLMGRLAKKIAQPVRRLLDARLAQAGGASDIQELWALQDVSFEIKRGEVWGIVGRNGSGKSTLLKILSRITAPTRGRVELFGRVGSLLEVGVGFHPDLTGRENIYLSGAIQGFKRDQVVRMFDEVVDFAELSQFIDTPVKRYSSGMYMRLAYSVAIHFEPDILILDEVLAVGDAAFQRKSLEKMEQKAKSGRTVLFVSHALNSVTRLCEKGIYLKEGKVDSIGSASEVVSNYMHEVHQIDKSRMLDKVDQPFMQLMDSTKRWDGYAKKILSWVSIHRLDGTLCNEFMTGDSMRIRIGFELDQDLQAYCSINFLNYLGMQVMTLKTFHTVTYTPLSGSGYLECVIHDLRLTTGRYILMLAIGEQTLKNSYWLDSISDTIHVQVHTGDYLGGHDLSQMQAMFAQKSEWSVHGN